MLYRQFCIQSLAKTYGDRNVIRQQDVCIRENLLKLFSNMTASGRSALQMHQATARSLDIPWTVLKSYETCFYCLRRAPENTLSCEHVICDVCVRNVGRETLTFDGQYRIDACLLCRTGKLAVGLRPLTAGLRILSIDGGGTRGVIAIGIMDLLQNMLGDSWKIQDLFDVAYGTSVGRLHVVGEILLS